MNEVTSQIVSMHDASANAQRAECALLPTGNSFVHYTTQRAGGTNRTARRRLAETPVTVL